MKRRPELFTAADAREWLFSDVDISVRTLQRRIKMAEKQHDPGVQMIAHGLVASEQWWRQKLRMEPRDVRGSYARDTRVSPEATDANDGAEELPEDC